MRILTDSTINALDRNMHDLINVSLVLERVAADVDTETNAHIELCMSVIETVVEELQHISDAHSKYASVGERITKARTEQGLTQETLAKACNTTVETIQEYESGERMPRDEMKLIIANALNARIPALFF